MKKIVSALCLALPAIFSVSAQNNPLPCGISTYMEEIRKNEPELYQLMLQEQSEQQIEYVVDGARASKIIPVVIHIVHNYGNENISDEQVYDAIRILNEDFQMRQPDTANIAAAFKGIQGNADFEFRLARKDPSGNCTNGITRTVSAHTFSSTESVKTIAPGWPRNRYMNVWIVQSIESGAGGYTMYPSSWLPANRDGIVVINRQFGGIGTSLGGNLARRTLSHEVGHWFNLKHTWGDSNTPGVASNCSMDDDVSDTPNTIGISTQNCNTAFESCGGLNNIQNIMDYSSCPIMFTQGQVSRMVTAANSTTAQRSSLWQNSNLVFTGVNDGFSDTICAPKADFKANKQISCVGSAILFTDLSYNGIVTSRTWTFTNITDGTTVLSSSAQNPSMTFSIPGIYSVTLAATNTKGTGSITKTGFVRIYPVGAQYVTNGFGESFEGDFENTGWYWANEGTNQGWELTTVASASGDRALVVRNYSAESGMAHNLYSPSYDLSAVTTKKIGFKFAYANRASDNTDRVRVFISVNCGNTWLQLSPPMNNADMTTGGIVSSSVYVPSDVQWEEKYYNIPSSVANSTNARFKIEFGSGGGNQFYLDDVNIPGIASIDDPVILGSSWEVFPNPADEYVDIRFATENVNVLSDRMVVYDASGRVVRALEINGGISTYRMNVADLKAGIYFIKAENGSFAGTKKIIIK